MYEIQTEDFYKDISKDTRKKFDTSDYPEKTSIWNQDRYLQKRNWKILRGDEAAGKQITHFVGLRAKLYNFKVEGNDVAEEKKCKGMKKNVIRLKNLSIFSLEYFIYFFIS